MVSIFGITGSVHVKQKHVQQWGRLGKNNNVHFVIQAAKLASSSVSEKPVGHHKMKQSKQFIWILNRTPNKRRNNNVDVTLIWLLLLCCDITSIPNFITLSQSRSDKKGFRRLGPNRASVETKDIVNNNLKRHSGFFDKKYSMNSSYFGCSMGQYTGLDILLPSSCTAHSYDLVKGALLSHMRAKTHLWLFFFFFTWRKFIHSLQAFLQQCSGACGL